MSAMDLLLGREAIGARELDSADACPPMTEAEFEAFHRATSKGLRAYAVRVLGGTTHADDIVQDAYLRFLRSRHQADSPAQHRSYLFKIASNLIVDHWRSHRLERGTPDAREPQTGHSDVPLRIDLQRAFAHLRPEERAMMWLAYVEGADHREIAQALGFRRGSVRVILHRTRRKLASMLRQVRASEGAS